MRARPASLCFYDYFFLAAVPTAPTGAHLTATHRWLRAHVCSILNPRAHPPQPHLCMLNGQELTSKQVEHFCSLPLAGCRPGLPVHFSHSSGSASDCQSHQQRRRLHWQRRRLPLAAAWPEAATQISGWQCQCQYQCGSGGGAGSDSDASDTHTESTAGARMINFHKPSISMLAVSISRVTLRCLQTLTLRP